MQDTRLNSSEGAASAAHGDFEEILCRAINDAMVEVLGQSGAQSVFFHLKLTSESVRAASAAA